MLNALAAVLDSRMWCGRARLLGLLCIAATVLLDTVGCGQTSGRIPVQGNVTYRGEPISNAVITFYPPTGRPIAAPISPSGTYTAELLPNQYTVVVNVGVTLPSGYKEGDPVPRPKIVLPAEYTTHARSRLTATVSHSTRAPIDFNLE
jgi:hypothetical protein